MTTKEAAKKAKVHQRTIRKWIDRGDLMAYQLQDWSYSIRKRDLDRAIKSYRKGWK